jgi:hypothetical protein
MLQPCRLLHKLKIIMLPENGAALHHPMDAGMIAVFKKTGQNEAVQIIWLHNYGPGHLSSPARRRFQSAGNRSLKFQMRAHILDVMQLSNDEWSQLLYSLRIVKFPKHFPKVHMECVKIHLNPSSRFCSQTLELQRILMAYGVHTRLAIRPWIPSLNPNFLCAVGMVSPQIDVGHFVSCPALNFCKNYATLHFSCLLSYGSFDRQSRCCAYDHQTQRSVRFKTHNHLELRRRSGGFVYHQGHRC